MHVGHSLRGINGQRRATICVVGNRRLHYACGLIVGKVVGKVVGRDPDSDCCGSCTGSQKRAFKSGYPRQAARGTTTSSVSCWLDGIALSSTVSHWNGSPFSFIVFGKALNRRCVYMVTKVHSW